MPNEGWMYESVRSIKFSGVCAASLLGMAMAIASPAQTFTTLAVFNDTNGLEPEAALVQGLDGNFYGTTDEGPAASSYGTIFMVTPTGVLTTLYSFSGTDGANPTATLVLGTDGNFYGTTFQGGNLTCGGGFGCGTVFQYTPGGTLTSLHSFDRTDGGFPSSGLVQATDGNFYGTTTQAGDYHACPVGCGTLFKITASGTLTTVHNFQGTDGASPSGSLMQGTDGSFYGTTSMGGPGGYGTIFKFTMGGTLTTLFSFDLTDGQAPVGGVVQAADGNFYGTTIGEPGCEGIDCGTFFKMTPAGDLTTLHEFNPRKGYDPLARLLQATDGNFYGLTRDGGINGDCCGTIFRIGPAGSLTTLYEFPGIPVGQSPTAGLMQATDGNLYGTTTNGGALGAGSVFRLSVGLGPFVKLLPHAGHVGSAVKILGTDLSGAIAVTFNGTPVAFTIGSATEISIKVPAGAASGIVQVTLPGGTLSSGQFIVGR